ncbi:MAG: stealth family protein [Tannerella sp.]|jgi:hypothetical protein|nr:stealth family protein [Tannerella sp.]
MEMNNEDYYIDFVITWVDMNDPKWGESFAKYANKIDNAKNEISKARFRDFGLLKYWFRGVEKFTPWVRKIHLVTCGQQPDWLNADNPRINLVNHEDIIPAQFLPCFNSAVIERYLHKINDLTEHFVYFNDDFFITNTIHQNRFFKNGLPCDIGTFRFNSGLSQWNKRLKNNVKLLNKHFDKKEMMSQYHDKWFNDVYKNKARLTYILKNYNKLITLQTPHNAQPFLKSTFFDVWQHCEKELTSTSANRFRDLTDYTPELFRSWQICKGNFEPYNIYNDTKMFPLVLRSSGAIKAIYEQTYLLICLNDNIHIRNYKQVIRNIRDSFDHILPQKSSFEI